MAYAWLSYKQIATTSDKQDYSFQLATNDNFIRYKLQWYNDYKV